MSDDLQFSFDLEISLNVTNEYQHNVLILNGKCCEYTGLKISFTGPSDKMSDDFKFGSDICMMMSNDLQFSLARK